MISSAALAAREASHEVCSQSRIHAQVSAPRTHSFDRRTSCRGAPGHGVLATWYCITPTGWNFFRQLRFGTSFGETESKLTFKFTHYLVQFRAHDCGDDDAVNVRCIVTCEATHMLGKSSRREGAGRQKRLLLVVQSHCIPLTSLFKSVFRSCASLEPSARDTLSPTSDPPWCGFPTADP